RDHRAEARSANTSQRAPGAFPMLSSAAVAETNGYFRFSPRILDHLGLSAYNSVPKCLVELVANSYDADAAEVRISLPDVVNETASVEVVDDGIGMSAAD